MPVVLFSCYILQGQKAHGGDNNMRQYQQAMLIAPESPPLPYIQHWQANAVLWKSPLHREHRGSAD